MIQSLDTVDYIVLGVYFLLIVLIGVWVSTKTKTGEDLFLGGRSLTWGLIGLSLFASNISSTTLIGLSGAAYKDGIANSNYEWLTGVPLILMALYFIPLYLKSRITTIPEFLELRYDRRSRTYFSVITIFISIMVDTAGGLYAGAIVLKTFFPDLVIWQTTMVLALFAGIYTAFGGLKAVVYTDALQAIVLVVGCSILTYILFEGVDFSWETVKASVPEGHLSVIKPIDDPGLPWLGTLLGVPILGFWYWVTNQYITQRVLGAKDMNHARWGAILGGALKIIPIFIMVIPGAIAISLYPGLDNPDMVFPTMVSDALPIGITGLVLAGLISAILSSVDSTLNSASTLVVVDFVQKKKPDLSPGGMAKYGRITTIILMVVAAVWAPLIAQAGGLWNYLQQAFSVVVPPIAVIFFMGVFYKKAGGRAAIYTLVLGHLIGLGLFVLGQFGYWNLHFTINVGIMFAVSALIFYIAGITEADPDPEKIRLYTYRKGLTKPEGITSIWLDYRLHIVGLVLAMLTILILFW